MLNAKGEGGLLIGHVMQRKDPKIKMRKRVERAERG